jgi:hypothetical protein
VSAACPRPDKHAYGDRKAAEAALDSLRARLGRAERARTRWLTAYRCQCGSWHVGDQRLALDRKIRDSNIRGGPRGRRP